jgi:hypothetical protein
MRVFIWKHRIVMTSKVGKNKSLRGDAAVRREYCDSDSISPVINEVNLIISEWKINDI